MIQLTSLMMAWLGVASLGFSFQSFHWFEIHNLGDPLNPYNHTLPSSNTTILQVRAHVGLWGACIVPEEDPLTPSPSNIPGPNPGPNDGPMCKSFQTTNHFLNVSAQTSNGNFEKYLLFPRSFMYLSLLFSIFGAVICSLLISGVGTTTLLDELRHRRYEEPQQLLDAAGELKQKKEWQNYSYYITCLCQAFFVLLGTGSAYLAIDTQRLVSHHTAINYYPVQITSKVVSSNAFFPALIGGITPLLSAFTWWCSQLISERSEGRSKQLTAPIARDGRREGGGNAVPVNIGDSPTAQHERRRVLHEHHHQQPQHHPQHHQQQQQQQQQRRTRQQKQSFSTLYRTPGGTSSSKPFPWHSMWKLFPLIAIPIASKSLVTANLPTLLINFFGKYEHCELKFPNTNQSSLRFTCANDAGTSYKASFDTLSALLAFCVTPFIGALSDQYGRKPLLIVSVLAACIPVLGLLLQPGNMLYYLALSLVPALTGSTYGTSPVLVAYVADLVGKRHRTVAMGILFAFVMFGLSVGPMLEIYLPQNENSRTNIFVIFIVLSLLLTIFVQCCMIETSPELLMRRQQQQQKQRNHQHHHQHQSEEPKETMSSSSSCSSSDDEDDENKKMHRLNPCRSVRLMFTSPLMQVVGVVTLFSNISESGVIELFLIYLKDVVNFTAWDNAYLLLVLALASCYTQTIVLKWFLLLSSETAMILCGLAANAIHLMMYALIGATHQKWIALLVCTFSSLTFLPVSAFSSIVSKHSDRRDRGLHLGTLISLRSLAR